MGLLNSIFGGTVAAPSGANAPTYGNPEQQAIQGTQAQQQAINGGSEQLLNQLQGQAAGTAGPSVAQTQLQAATQQNNQQAAGMLGSQRGINPALAARQIMSQNAQNNQAAANQ